MEKAGGGEAPRAGRAGTGSSSRRGPAAGLGGGGGGPAAPAAVGVCLALTREDSTSGSASPSSLLAGGPAAERPGPSGPRVTALPRASAGRARGGSEGPGTEPTGGAGAALTTGCGGSSPNRGAGIGGGAGSTGSASRPAGGSGTGAAGAAGGGVAGRGAGPGGTGSGWGDPVAATPRPSPSVAGTPARTASDTLAEAAGPPDPATAARVVSAGAVAAR
jgi:hypothetical protein